jgi:SAM-dependent methyltransferase
VRHDPVSHELVDNLRLAYDRGADRRDGYSKQQWKLVERSAFLDRLRADGSRRLLEIGAGTGQDSEFFASNGLDVTAIDLSPEMVERCRRKGIAARVVNLLELDKTQFGEPKFDAVYSLNCLLHVPNADLPAVLAGIGAVMRPGGLFYLGVWGGDGDEGAWEHDSHDPPRFFSLRTNAQIRGFVSERFAIEDFHVIETTALPFQSLTLRNLS